ncbi:MAG: CopG family transcriptional regulator [Nitrospirae bacterium]|nr:CopG family transcriptional regulator [Nitrospirota bacterium]MBF0534173.1 CopG family transcriptional regulator [Nitrospirota bacterium]MBF0617060.1 CopG family transcriptional regulator [Nitrospirota bacterium]
MKTTLTISDDLSERLSALAKTEHQSESSLASEAIEEFLSVRQWHIQAINEGIEAADRGDVVSHEEAAHVLTDKGSCFS